MYTTVDANGHLKNGSGKAGRCAPASRPCRGHTERATCVTAASVFAHPVGSPLFVSDPVSAWAGVHRGQRAPCHTRPREFLSYPVAAGATPSCSPAAGTEAETDDLSGRGRTGTWGTSSQSSSQTQKCTQGVRAPPAPTPVSPWWGRGRGVT